MASGTDTVTVDVTRCCWMAGCAGVPAAAGCRSVGKGVHRGGRRSADSLIQAQAQGVDEAGADGAAYSSPRHQLLFRVLKRL